MPANLENSAVKKVSFHSNPKERQCQRMGMGYDIFSLFLSSFQACPQGGVEEFIGFVPPGVKHGIF